MLRLEPIKFDDFQIATDDPGRGVLRLLLLQQQLNLLSIFALGIQLVAVLFPSMKMPLAVCFSFEIMSYAMGLHRNVSSLAIGLGRYST